ncbi:MAG TPA: adenosylcobinamide-phosphate synthase CbiB [Vicinamibacterales bacterium]|nr:adenosylcobinamide-phosphate synthase CbiB [Vicinamibacterales bacterium]
MLFVPHDWRLALSTVLLAGLFDVLIGEPPNALHPVVWVGRLISALMGRRPHGRPQAEFAYGVLIVLVTAGSAAAAGLLLTLGLSHLPWWVALPIGAWVLKSAFSLRGLVRAGRDVQRALARDTGEARTRLAALVSRSPEMEPPLIVSATVESLAENLTDSVVSPLLYFVLFGLPGALAYRAINTMDAMMGYRDEREYVGKAAARTDDVANWVPTRIAALLIVAVAGLRGAAQAAWAALRTQHRPEYGPNKTLAIATMAGALGVQLKKPGAYALGTPTRPLTADVIGDATWYVWVAGGVTIAASAGLAALLAGTVWG